MPDIFGRDRSDYTFIRDMDEREEGRFERHQEAHAARLAADIDGFDPQSRHDFDALGVQERTAVNAQAIGFTTNNLLAIQSMVEEILYTGYRADEFVPFETNLMEGASSYTPRIVDMHGEGKFLDSRGSSAETVRVSQATDPQPLIIAGINAEWTAEDIRNAQMTGLPLETLSLEGAIERAYDHVEKVALQGNTERGWRGLSNLTAAGDNITSNAFTGTFASSTALEIQAAISTEISNLITDSNEVVGRKLKDGLAIYLPGAEYDLLCNPLGDDANKSIMDWLERMNPFTKMTGNPVKFHRLMELSSTMLTTVKDKRVFEMAMPISPRVIKIMDMGRNIVAQIEYKIGRFYVKRPSYIRQLTAI